MQVRKLALCGTDSPTIGPDSPVVLAIKVLYSYPGKTAEQQGHMGRAEMISTPFREYERQIRQQFTDMFARSGFDGSRDIAGIILNAGGTPTPAPPLDSTSAKTASPRREMFCGPPHLAGSLSRIQIFPVRPITNPRF
jgi:hypothetical protein